MNPRARFRTAVTIAALVVAVGILLAAATRIPSTLGSTDFRPYWSSTYLLAHGEDFGDVVALDTVERRLTGWQEPYAMYAWFAPTGNLVLLPLVFVPFVDAVRVWLLANILLVSIAGLAIWSNVRSQGWVPLAAAFAFSMTLLSITYGQVNSLVLIGLALFLLLVRSNHNFSAGAALALTTVKPHLVIIALPLLIVDFARRKEWRVLAGFCAALAGSALLLFVLYPAWVGSYSRLVTFGLSLDRMTPTLSGLLAIAGVRWGKWIWTGVLAVAVVVWWKHGKRWNLREMVDISIIVGFLISPVGWSYDQVILLIPIFHVLEWITEGSLHRGEAAIVVLALLAADAITFYERSLDPNDVWFFWVPFVVGMVYLFAWHRRRPVSKSADSLAPSLA